MIIHEFLSKMIEMKASDLHLKCGSPPIARVNRDLVPLGSEILTNPKITEIAMFIMTPPLKKRFEDELEVDFAYTFEGYGRFRTNIFIQRGMISIVMRFVKYEVPSFNEINIPSTLENLCSQERGIILVSGATNSGKSTTLAAMINHINRNYRKHIISIEDPIEFIHQDRLSVINQREVGIDTLSFG
ncbi:MAG: hypothetical protein ACD_79C00709G0001, partial [uncultured bacterium]